MGNVRTESRFARPLVDVRTTGRSRRVLVVDDNVDAAEIMAMLLEFLGHQVQIAHDGVTGFKAAWTFRPDIVLLDVGLPSMNGYEVARCLRREPETAKIFLVALTGYGREEDRRLSKEAGFNVHVLKPLGIDALRSILAQAESVGQHESAMEAG